jgi:spermidine synthase
MSYPSGLWSFTYASKGLCPLKDFDSSRVQGDFEYYNPQIHWGSFMIPEFMKKEHGNSLTPLPEPSWT